MQLSVDQWQQVQNDLKVQVGHDDYNSWLLPLRPEAPSTSELAQNLITLSVPTSFMQDWVNQNYGDIIQKTLSKTLDKSVNVVYRVAPAFDVKPPKNTSPIKGTILEEAFKPKNISAQTAVDDLHEGTKLDPRFTFETFVTGQSNQFAFAAAQRISESGDLAYNPFFLHGGVGLGKTHLMHSIGWHVLKNHPERKVLYISAEQFLYRFIRALKDKSTLSFKDTFRSVDVLMIDDIQFIAGKGATQEEFFHTFNALVGMGKQIILTADRSPHEMEDIEDRLRSRLGCGLTCEVHPPEVETRLAILQRKADALGFALSEDVAMFLANAISTNVRELEGALNRLAAHAKLTNAEVTISFVQEQLRDLFRSSMRAVTLDEIQKKVADYYSIKIADMHGTRRSRPIARPRQVAMFLAKQLTTKSYPEIGRAFGGRDHTTVMHAVKTIENLTERDPQLAEDVRLLERILSNR